MQTPRIVFSDTLDSVSEGCRLVRSSEAVAEVRHLKQETQGHLGLGGATLAASLIDLIDEFRIWINPVAVGGGKPFFPVGREQLRLRLAEHRASSAPVTTDDLQRFAARFSDLDNPDVMRRAWS